MKTTRVMRWRFVSFLFLLVIEPFSLQVLTEEQKMEEGKRMFSIFAARMFEQRVLQAYREKVAQERQLQLLRELEDEDKLREEKEKEKEKKKEKKKDKKKSVSLSLYSFLNALTRC